MRESLHCIRGGRQIRRNFRQVCLEIGGNGIVACLGLRGIYIVQSLQSHFGYSFCKGFYAVSRFFGRGKNPVHLFVFMECGKYLISHVQMDGKQFSGVSLIRTCYGNFNALRVGIRVPARRNVKPCIQSGHYENSHNDYHGNDIVVYFLYVITENRKNISHQSFSFLRKVSSICSKDMPANCCCSASFV